MRDFLDSDNEFAQTPGARVDVISIGDQMCEISAACRLGEEFGHRLKLLKLVLILDPTNSRFSFQDPAQFVQVSMCLSWSVIPLDSQQLSYLQTQVLKVLELKYESVLDENDWKGIQSPSPTDCSIKENASYWVPQPASLTYAIGKPGRFPSDFPLYLPVEYLNLTVADVLCDADEVKIEDAMDPSTLTFIAGDYDFTELTLSKSSKAKVVDKKDFGEQLTRRATALLERAGMFAQNGSNASRTETVTTTDCDEEIATNEILVL